MTAHQRIIREVMAETHPRQAALSLAGYSVETISRADATPIIMHYEWLRSMGQATVFVGLISPAREIEGVACFGWGTAAGRPKREDNKFGTIRDLIGAPAFCLERGACVHFAPPNAASFLITAACKLICRVHGVARFFAYADPMAGEYGAVYQAANWLYLGQGLNNGNDRKHRWFVLAPGKDRNVASNWQTTRVLRQQKPPLKVAEARALGWEIGWREAKHVYAINIGHDRKRWRKQFPAKPYPAPRPELKRKSVAEVPFRIVPPVKPQSDFFAPAIRNATDFETP